MNNSGAEIQSQHLTHTMQCLQTDIQTTPARKSNDLRASVSPKQRMCDGFIDCSNGEVSRSCFCHSGSQGLTHVLNSIVSYKSCRFSYIVYSIIKTLTTWQYWSKCLPCGRMSLCSCVALTSAGRRMSGVCVSPCASTLESHTATSASAGHAEYRLVRKLNCEGETCLDCHCHSTVCLVKLVSPSPLHLAAA